MQIAHFLRRIILSCGLSGPNTFFHIVSQKTRLSERNIVHKTCVLIFFFKLSFVTFLILRNIQHVIIINVCTSSWKIPVILVRLQSNLKFLGRFFKNFQISNFLNVRPVGAELFHADRETDMAKLIVAFRIFAKVPKKLTSWNYYYAVVLAPLCSEQ